jgi:CelD/BcsL family acetyltransferase involved in cellulose biosynthesis
MTLSYQVIRDSKRFEELRNPWSVLLDQSVPSSPFLTWEWMFAWWIHYCDGDHARRLSIVVARRGDEIVGILPGYVYRRRLGLSTFAFLGTEFESSDYLGVIEKQQGGASALPGMLDFVLREEPGVDVLHLSNVLALGSTLDDLHGYAVAGGHSHYLGVFKTCPYVVTAGDWEKYLDGLSSKMRKNVRRSTRQLVDAHAEFTLVRSRDQVRSAITELFELHSRRFVMKNAKTGFRAETRGPFHAAVSELFFDADILRLFLLKVSGRTVAALYCFEYAGTLHFFQSGIDPASERLSAGTVLVGHAIRYAFEHGLTCFDFMRGEEAYKFRWTDKSRRMFAVRLGVSRRGRFYLARQAQSAKIKSVLKRVTAGQLRRRAAASVLEAS